MRELGLIIAGILLGALLIGGCASTAPPCKEAKGPAVTCPQTARSSTWDWLEAIGEVVGGLDP